MSKYDYQLYELKHQSYSGAVARGGGHATNGASGDYVNKIKISINKNVIPVNSVKNVIYPTHDGKVYVVFEVAAGASPSIQFPQSINVDNDVGLVKCSKDHSMVRNFK